MNHQFDWRDEEDPSLTLDPSQSGNGQQKAGNWKRFLSVIALVLISSVGVMLFRELQRYLDQTNSMVQENLLAQNDLVLSAAKNADRDILASLISDRDPVWTEGQLALVASGLMFDRSAFGLNIIEASPKIEQLTISPELDSATIIVRFSYELESENTRERMFDLYHELNYRHSNGRWLLSAPADDYWAGSILDEGHYISIRYPAKDYYYGERLAVDLEALTAEFCNRYLTSFCKTELPMKIVLSANPKSITQTEIQTSLSQATNHIELPTPTIFGIPEDEEGYRAIYRALGRRLVARMVMSESGWACCDRKLLHQSLLDQHFIQLALRSSISLAAYTHLDIQESLLELGEQIWSVDELSDNSDVRNDKMAADILVGYLMMNRIGADDFHLHQKLIEADSFHDWLQMSFEPAEVENLKEGWHSYLQSQFGSGEK